MVHLSIRYMSLYGRTDAEEVAQFMGDLLRGNPDSRFYLIVAPNRMFAFGAKDERAEQWRLKEFRYFRDDEFSPKWLFFTPFFFLRGEYAATFYGGIVGKVEREEPSVPLHFYLLGSDIGLTEDEREAGGTKEAVWEIFDVRNTAGRATVRPLLSEAEPLKDVPTLSTSLTELYDTLTDYVIKVMWE